MAERFSHYLLIERIGTGGMGAVWRALDESSGQEVALKVLHPHLAADVEYVRRFEREARIAASIDSPYIVKLMDSGHADGTYFLVMELVTGRTLAQLIAERGRLPLEETESIASAMAAALAAAWARGIIHRDVSPQNVVVRENGRVKVMDFGISRDLGQATVTSASVLMGKPHYLAPELVTGARADVRADIYAFGIVLFQMLTGQVPFSGENTYATMMKHVSEPVPDIELIRPEVPAWLVSIVERCLAKAPEERFQTPGELLTALAARFQTTPAPASVETVVVDLEPTMRLADVAAPPETNPTVRIERLDEPAEVMEPEPAAVDEGQPQYERFLAPASVQQAPSPAVTRRWLLLLPVVAVLAVVVAASAYFALLRGGSDDGRHLPGVPPAKEIHEFVLPGTPIGALFLPDGQRLYAAFSDGTGRLLDIGTGKEIRTYPTLNTTDRRGNQVAFSQDGKLALLPSPRGITVRDIESGADREIALEAMPDSLSISPDGSFAMLDYGNGDLAISLQDGSTLGRLPTRGSGGNVWASAVSPDGKTALTATYDDNLVRFWDIASGKVLSTVTLNLAGRLHMQFAGDGKRAFVADPLGKLSTIDLAQGKVIASFEIKPYYEIEAAVASPDNRMLLVGESGNEKNDLALLFDLSTGRAIRRLEGHRDVVRNVAFSPDSRYGATVSEDSTVRIWDLS